MGERIKPRLPLLPLIPLVIVFLVSGAMLTRHYIRSAGERRALVELAMQAETPETPVPTPVPLFHPTPVPAPAAPAVLNQYQALHEQNPDMAGWIKIEGTCIDYPVMYTPGDGEFYLSHGFDKAESKGGVPFIDARCTVDPFGTNTIIYGHHMKNGTMFAGLLEYENESFYRAYPTIQFDTLYAEQEYEIIAVFRSRIYYQSDTVFKHYNFFNAEREEDFDNFIDSIKKLALYDTGVTAAYGDELITLVTCAYHTENGQFVVVAKKRDANNNFFLVRHEKEY